MRKVATCGRCGNKFEYETTGGQPRKWCGPCRVGNKKRCGACTCQCEECGVMFPPMWGKANRYCSKECAVAAVIVKVAVACERCGASTVRKSCKAGRFCSHECYWGTRELIACPVCETEFERTASTADGNRYCSPECAHKAQRASTASIGPEPPPVIGGRWVRLTLGHFALVDEERFEELNAYSWHVAKPQSGRALYAYRGDPSGASVAMHVQVMGYPSLTVDHVDANNTLDNRRSNLRVATKAQQTYNRRKFPGCSSMYKGVSAYPGGWLAAISADKVHHHIGCFSDEIEAALAYDAKARELHGPFARLNFPNEGEQSAIPDECAA